VIGVGNRWREDDGAGLVVAQRLTGAVPESVEVLEHEGEPTSLVEAWEGADAVWLVDAVSSGAPPGTVYRLDAGDDALPARLFRASTHHVGLAETVELARTLGRLPARTIVFGIEGARFRAGEGLTPEVAAAVARVADAVAEEVSSA
jgi:hydrogenase maturation protease